MPNTLTRLIRQGPVNLAVAAACFVACVAALVLAAVDPAPAGVGRASDATAGKPLIGLTLSRQLSGAKGFPGDSGAARLARPGADHRGAVLLTGALAIGFGLTAGLALGLAWSGRRGRLTEPAQRVIVRTVADDIDQLARLRAQAADRDRRLAALGLELARLDGEDTDVDPASPEASLRRELRAANAAVRNLEDLLREQQAVWSGIEDRSTRDNVHMDRLQRDLEAAAAIIDTLHDDVATWKQRAIDPAQIDVDADDDPADPDAKRLAGSG